MILNNRILFSDNGTLNDLSISLNDFRAQDETIAIVAAEDKLYFGSPLPFNHRWFEISSVNAATATVSKIEVWDGDEWQEVVDIIDQTAIAGVTLAQSGIISWVPDKEEGWVRDDTNDTDNSADPIEDLDSVIIYDLYWVRFTFDADLSSNTALRFVGHKFSNENDLGGQYPELTLSTTKTQFKAGKVDWFEQEFIAAEEIISELERDEVVRTRDNILNWERFNLASVHKVAEIIYRAFGDDYVDNRKTARDYYFSNLRKGRKEIDRNRNARQDPLERIDGQGTLVR